MIAKTIEVTRSMVPYDSSMRLDYLNRRPMEVEAIFGNPLRAARASGARNATRRNAVSTVEIPGSSQRPIEGLQRCPSRRGGQRRSGFSSDRARALRRWKSFAIPEGSRPNAKTWRDRSTNDSASHPYRNRSRPFRNRDARPKTDIGGVSIRLCADAPATNGIALGSNCTSTT